MRAVALVLVLAGTSASAFAGDPPPQGPAPAPAPQQPPAQPPPAPPAAAPATPPAKPPPVVLPDEDPELEGEAKKKYEEEFQRLWKGLAEEKNNVIVQGRIEQYGATPSRASRDVLIKYATGNKNQEFTSYAFKAIAKIGGKKAIAFLAGKNALRGGDFLIQQTAAEALAETKDARAAAQLLDVLNDKSTKTEVVGACAIAAAKAAPTDERVIETLFGLAENKKDTIRAYVMEALGHLKSDRALERLKQALETDKNTRVRESAAKGMGNSLRAEARPMLEKAAQEDKALTVKSAALESIRKIEAGR